MAIQVSPLARPAYRSQKYGNLAFSVAISDIQVRKLLGPEIGMTASNGPYWLLTEDLLSINRVPLYPLFWSRAYKVNGLSSCWPWLGSVTRSGYGRLAIWKRNVYAHRVAYTLTYGPIPPDRQVDHLCRNRRCVNPTHLEPVTCRENLMRGDTIAATHANKTACVHGHPYTEANLYIERYRRRMGEWKTCRRCRKCKGLPQKETA